MLGEMLARHIVRLRSVTVSETICHHFKNVRGFAPAAARHFSTSGAYGNHFSRLATEEESRRSSLRGPRAESFGPPDLIADYESQVRKQIKRLLMEVPSHASARTAFLLHQRGVLQPIVKPWDKKDFAGFEKLFNEERFKHSLQKRSDVSKRRRRRRDHARQNEGYKEEDEVYEAEEEEFTDAWRQKSIVEDVWKAEQYRQSFRELQENIPEREPLAARTDRLADVMAAGLRSHYLDQRRPVLTHELADFENPYMMKRSAMERLLHERCVRNQLDERVMPRLLDQHPDLVKLRAKASLPPEVLEPLAAFRGDVRWNFDVRDRLMQKLQSAETALEAFVARGKDAEIADVLPENNADGAAEASGLHHPWRNHVGFESAVPRGAAGGTKFGQPLPSLRAQILGLRYPTLQRVAHTLPSDPKWRAHVVRSIRVLERSKEWDFQSKLTAVNKLKEIYDLMKPSDAYTEALDEKMPVNRVPSHLKRKYARDAQYVKSFPKNYIKRKSFFRYRASLTATAPLKKEKKQ